MKRHGREDPVTAVSLEFGVPSPCATRPPAAARCLEQAVWQLRVDRRVLIGPGSAARTSYLPPQRFEPYKSDYR
jgi:hypothetical protein